MSGLGLNLSSYLKGVDMHTKSSDWKRVIIIIIVIAIMLVPTLVTLTCNELRPLFLTHVHFFTSEGLVLWPVRPHRSVKSRSIIYNSSNNDKNNSQTLQ
jgi:hypothetical protein